MKKQIRKAMICTIAMMLVAVVTLTGVTFAWFSASDSASVSDMTVSVAARDGGVYISKDPYSGFGTSISIDVPAVSFETASTAGEVDANGLLKFFKGSLSNYEDITVDAEEIPDPGAYYIMQEVYFDNSSSKGELTVSLNGTKINNTNSNRPVNAATRIAVVTHGSIDKATFDSRKPTPQNPDIIPYPKGIPTVQILETNPNDHISKGLNEYKFMTGLDSVGSNEVFTYYYGIKNATKDIYRLNKKADLSSANDANLVKLEHKADKSTTILRSNPNDVEIVIPAESYLKTVIYIWIEGQDPDCQNDVSGAPYTANITFTKKSVKYPEGYEPEKEITCTNTACQKTFLPSAAKVETVEDVVKKSCPHCSTELPKVEKCTNTECEKPYYHIDAKTKDGKKVCPYCETEMPAAS